MWLLGIELRTLTTEPSLQLSFNLILPGLLSWQPESGDEGSGDEALGKNVSWSLASDVTLGLTTAVWEMGVEVGTITYSHSYPAHVTI